MMILIATASAFTGPAGPILVDFLALLIRNYGPMGVVVFFGWLIIKNYVPQAITAIVDLAASINGVKAEIRVFAEKQDRLIDTMEQDSADRTREYEKTSARIQRIEDSLKIPQGGTKS